MKQKTGAGRGRPWRFATVRPAIAASIGVATWTGCVAPRVEVELPAPRAAIEVHEPEDQPVESRPLATTSAVSGEVQFLHRGGPAVDLGATVVYLRPKRGAVRWAPASSTVRVTSSTEAFAPPLTVVRPGESVALVNDGPLVHRLFSSDLDSDATELGPGERAAPIRIVGRGAFRFYCSLHADETFVVYAVDATHFAVLRDETGYAFESVPPGQYTLSIWSERVSGPVRDVYVDGFSRTRESIWLDARLINR